MPARCVCVLLVLFGAAQWLPGQTAHERAREAYYSAKEQYYAGDYATAERGYGRAERLFERAGDTLYVAKAAKRRGDVARRQRYFDTAIEHYTRAGAVYRSRLVIDTLALADLALTLGHVYSSAYLPARSDSFYRVAIRQYAAVEGPRSSLVGNGYMSIAVNATKRGRYLDAERDYERARAIFEAGPPDSKDRYRIYSNAGTNYRKLGDYDRARQYAERALTLKLEHYPPEHPSVPKYYSNIGKVLRDRGDYEKALPYFEKALALSEESLGADHPTTYGATGELGSAYADLDRGAEALKYYRRAIRGMRKHYPPTHPYLVGGYFNIGRVLEDQGKYAAALDQYRRTLRLFETSPEPFPQYIAQTRYQIARVLDRQGFPDSTLVLVQRALQELSPNESLTAYANNPHPDSLQARLDALQLFALKISALRQRASAKPAAAELLPAFATAERALEVVSRVRAGYLGESSRRELRERVDPLYHHAVALAFELYQLTGEKQYLQRAVEISNAAKAGLLCDQLRDDEALALADLPAAASTELARARTAVQRAREAYEGTPTPTRRQALREAELLHLHVQEELRRTYPRYAALRSQSDVVTVARLQGTLAPETALLDYYRTDSVLYIFCIKNNTLAGQSRPIGASFAKHLAALLPQSLSVLLGDPAALRAYRAANAAVYAQLVEPMADQLTHCTNLIVVPHAQLHRLSFEALTTSPPNASPRYLLERFAVSYAPAAGLAVRVDGYGPVATRRDFLGSAPRFDPGAAADPFRAALGPLPYAAEEIALAARYFKGAVQLDTAARESAFVRAAPGTRVLHLATHGRLDDAHPLRSGLYFRPAADTLDDGFLSALEIYGLHLDAELAVLSACQTGAGPLATGEGSLNLARAFTFAGCRSVLLSRWLANDRATAAIVGHFYRHLAAGLSKPAALRQAKLDYLATADPLAQHPYFWAGLVLTGDTAPLATGGAYPWGWWVIGLLGLGMLGWVWWKQWGES